MAYNLSGLQQLNSTFGGNLGYHGNLGTKQLSRLAEANRIAAQTKSADEELALERERLKMQQQAQAEQLRMQQEAQAMQAQLQQQQLDAAKQAQMQDALKFNQGFYNPTAQAQQQARIEQATLTPLQKLQQQAQMAQLQQQINGYQPQPTGDNPATFHSGAFDPNANLRTAAEAAQLQSIAQNTPTGFSQSSALPSLGRSGSSSKGGSSGGGSGGSGGSSSSGNDSRFQSTGTGGLPGLGGNNSGASASVGGGGSGLGSGSSYGGLHVGARPAGQSAYAYNPGATSKGFSSGGLTGLPNETTTGPKSVASILNAKPINTYSTGISGAQAATSSAGKQSSFSDRNK